MTSPPDAPDPLDAKATRRGWMAALGVSLGTAFLIISPFFWRGTASGHDIAFHASSWLDVAGQWKEGIVFPRWCEWANNGFGEPRFIFYPPLSWLLGAALGFVVPWNAVPGTFLVLVQTLAGVSMFALARRFFPAGAALFAAACYTANPYALLVVYLRSDFAEELAWAFLPAFLLAALQRSGLMENRWGSGPRSAAIFGLFFAAIWLANAPAGTCLMLRPSAIIWEYVPELRFVQFPWRWMGILALAYACFGAAAVAPRRVAWIWCVVVILAMAGTATFLVRKAWWDSDDIPSLQEAISSGKGFDGTDEYDPAGDDHSNLPAKAPPVMLLLVEGGDARAAKAEIHIARWTAEEKDLSVTSPQPLRLAIRLLDYPAWRLEINGQPAKPEFPEGTTQVILPLPAGTEGIKVGFGRTPDRTVGNALSLASLAVCAAFLRKQRTRNQSQ